MAKRFVPRALPKRYDEDLNHSIRRLYLDDQAYGDATRSLPITNTDVLIVNFERETAYLARRCVIPIKGLWLIGGRRFAGERIMNCMHRCFKRETSLDVDKKRFEYVCRAEFTWSNRLQTPQDAGAHNNADIFVIELKDEELQQATAGLDPKEYVPGSLREYTRAQLVEALVENPCQRALLDYYDEVFPPL
jgi:ADP-ribose pyrophosphatase YjhB (NUDIX family)